MASNRLKVLDKAKELAEYETRDLRAATERHRQKKMAPMNLVEATKHLAVLADRKSQLLAEMSEHTELIEKLNKEFWPVLSCFLYGRLWEWSHNSGQASLRYNDATGSWTANDHGDAYDGHGSFSLRFPEELFDLPLAEAEKKALEIYKERKWVEKSAAEDESRKSRRKLFEELKAEFQEGA